MKKDLLFMLFLFYCGSTIAQIKTEFIDSKMLNSKRSISIKLPKNYNHNGDAEHPVIVILDGDYLFKPVIGQIDFQTYFNNMPGSIIVGINHGNMRPSDILYDSVSGLPVHSGSEFYEFIAKELLVYIDENYNTSEFRVIVGHEKSANLMNSFLLEGQPLFQAYVNLSPEFEGAMSQNIIKRIQWLNDDIIYYMATATNDIESTGTSLLNLKDELNYIDNEYFKLYFDNFESASYHAMVMSGMARGFEKIFDIYKPVIDSEIKDRVISYEPILD